MFSLIDNIYASKGLYQEILAPVCKKHDLTESALTILLYLAEDNDKDTASDIIKDQRLKKSLVSVSIKELLSRGLISKVASDSNRRMKHLVVNDSAREIVKEAQKQRDSYYAILMQGFDKQEKQDLRSYLMRINENINRHKT
ncbi:MAG: winged helix DNA-binding protein [Erysipelotrichaceae bacterium]|nr:winged helix DNA-binding protein [Erysipelotrichaceae bacterium]